MIVIPTRIPKQLQVFVHGDILGMMARGSRIAATQPPGWVDTGRADEASEQARKDEAHMRSIAHAVYTRERTPPPAVALVELPFGQVRKPVDGGRGAHSTEVCMARSLSCFLSTFFARTD
jgi:hypothetical protein